MNKMLQRTLAAYRPLYLHGVLRDGPCRMAGAAPTDVDRASPVRRRTLLAALMQIVIHPRSK